MTAMARVRTNFVALGDEELVGHLRAGNRDAFETVIQRYNQRLYRVARTVLRDDTEAEDVVQDAYMRAFSRIASFRGEASLSTWLTRIALNEALDRVRQRRPTAELTEIDTIAGRKDAVMVPTDTTDPERIAARTEVRQLVEQAIDNLPEAFRLVFVMRDIEDMSIGETARHLGIRTETVKTRLHRARRMLRTSLEDTLASALTDSFPFAGPRCAQVTERVLQRLGLAAAS